MNNITLVLATGDALNISTVDADPVTVPGVLLQDSVSITYMVEKPGNTEVLQAKALTVIRHFILLPEHG